jgi:hypothetical protein
MKNTFRITVEPADKGVKYKICAPAAAKVIAPSSATSTSASGSNVAARYVTAAN